ncbi:MAG: PP2C family protein-serine/threonine phosphatase, partial [Planctomycetia bacterium]
AGGGHPPALIYTGPSAGDVRRRVVQMESQGPMIGAFEGVEYESGKTTLDAVALVFLFSDGCCEIHQTDDTMWSFEEFLDHMAAPSTPGLSDMDRLLAHTRALRGNELFEDDFSIVEFRL